MERSYIDTAPQGYQSQNEGPTMIGEQLVQKALVDTAHNIQLYCYYVLRMSECMEPELSGYHHLLVCCSLAETGRMKRNDCVEKS